MRPPAPRRVCGGCGNTMLSEVVASDQGVSWGMTLPRGDTGRCLRTSVFITNWGCSWHRMGGDQGSCPSVPRTAPHGGCWAPKVTSAEAKTPSLQEALLKLNRADEAPRIVWKMRL